MPEHLLLYSVLLPAGIALVTVLVGRRPWRSGTVRDGVAVAALAVGLGFAASLLLDPAVGFPRDRHGLRLPENPWELLPFCGLLFLGMRVGLRQEEGRLPFGSWMIVGVVCIALAWLHAREIIDMDTWDRKAVAPIAVVFGMLWAGHTSMLDSLCSRRGGPSLSLGLVLVAVATWGCILLAEVPPEPNAVRLAEAALALAATLAVLTVVGYARPQRAAVRGLAFPFSGALVAILLQGFLAYDLPWLCVLLLGGAPAVFYIDIGRRRLPVLSVLRASLVLVPAGAALVWAWYQYRAG